MALSAWVDKACLVTIVSYVCKEFIRWTIDCINYFKAVVTKKNVINGSVFGSGQGRAGQGRAGQGRAGQGRAGQGRAGQGRAG